MRPKWGFYEESKELHCLTRCVALSCGWSSRDRSRVSRHIFESLVSVSPWTWTSSLDLESWSRKIMVSKYEKSWDSKSWLGVGVKFWIYLFKARNTYKDSIDFLGLKTFLIAFQPEVESRTQGSRPRTQKKSEAKAKDSLSEDRHSRGQGQESSRPRPRTKDTKRKCSPKKKKRSSQKFFRRSPKKKGLHENFSNNLH